MTQKPPVTVLFFVSNLFEQQYVQHSSHVFSTASAILSSALPFNVEGRFHSSGSSLRCSNCLRPSLPRHTSRKYLWTSGCLSIILRIYGVDDCVLVWVVSWQGRGIQRLGHDEYGIHFTESKVSTSVGTSGVVRGMTGGVGMEEE